MASYRLFIDPERRIPNFNNSYTSLAELPSGTTQEVVGLTASDGGATVGVLHQPAGGSRACAFFMHPKSNHTRPYLAPSLLASRIAVWGQMSRHINNDIDMTHEEVALDAAAGMRYLREKGFETIVAVGNSGGSSLLAYYQALASQEPSKRQQTSPAGEPTGFNDEDMPAFDLYVALALHAGEGSVLLNMLDPAVVDESNPIPSDPELDMYSYRNGYRDFPKPSHYDPEWVKRFRAAQVERCRRLDNIALGIMDDYNEARRHADPKVIDSATARRAMYARIMTVHRTWASVAMLDPAISPNRRPIGMTGGEHPIRLNYGIHGFARVITPRAWLSTWSGLSSKAELAHTVPQIRVPSLFIYPDGDFAMYPDELNAIFAASPAKDKQLVVVEWSQHYLTPVPGTPDNLPHPKVRAGEAAVNWINARLR